MRKALLPLLVFLFSPIVASADTTATPCSYLKYSPDRQYAFVMFTLNTERECISQGSTAAEESKMLREKYKVSGLYADGNPKKLEWQLAEPWYAFQVLVSNDGESVVRKGPWASEMTQEA